MTQSAVQSAEAEARIAWVSQARCRGADPEGRGEQGQQGLHAIEQGECREPRREQGDGGVAVGGRSASEVGVGHRGLLPPSAQAAMAEPE